MIRSNTRDKRYGVRGMRIHLRTWIALGVMVILAPIAFFTLYRPGGAGAEWFDDNWAYRKKLTIDADQVSGSTDLTDFVVLVSLTDSDLPSRAQADGDDILFTDINGRKLSHELASYTSGTGALTAWVKVPTVYAATDTILYMYYGNSVSGAQQNKMDVWTDYQAVWHMDESSDGSGAVSRLDSSPNLNTLSDNNTTASGTGKFGLAADFERNDTEFLSIADSALSANFPGKDGNTSVSAVTFSAWINAETLPSSFQIYSIFGKRYSSGSDNVYELIFNDSGGNDYFQGSINTDIAQGPTTTYSAGTWYYLTLTYDDALASDSIVLYLNGSSIDTGASNGPVGDNTQTFTIGETYQTTRHFDGLIDEFRVRNTAHSADWIATEYANMNAPGTFISAGSEEAAPGPIAFWKFDEGVDNQCGTDDACDQTTRQNHLARSNATWQNEDMCVDGKCFFFDGTDDYLSRADDGDLDFTQTDSMTLTAWFRHGPQSSGTDVLLAKSNSSAGYKILMESDGDITCGIDDDTTWDPDGPASSTAATYDDNLWHHVACVKSGSSSLSLYIDGQLITTNSSISGIGSLANSATFYTGVDGDGTSNEWQGYIDEVRVYRYARNEREIQADYAGGAALLGKKDQAAFLTDGLVGYWKMDDPAIDAEGEVAVDASGNSNNGTLYGDDSTGDNGTGMGCDSVGKFGYGCEFDGTDDYVAVTTSDTLAAPPALTVAFWVNADNWNSSPGLVDKNRFSEWDIHYNGGVIFEGRAPDSGTIIKFTGPSLGTGDWHHVVVAYDGAGNKKMYYDGVSQSVTINNDSTGAINSGVSDVNLGRRHDGGYLDGRLDDVRIYRRYLSETEIYNLYNWAPGPLGHWKLDEATLNNDCSTDSAFDSSGNGNNADSCPASTGQTATRTGKFGNAAYFDSSNDYLALPAATELRVHTQNFTVSGWARMDSAGTDRCIFCFGDTGGAIELRYDDGDDYFEFDTYDGGWQYAKYSQANPTLGTWYHVAGVRDGATLKIYVNGVLGSTTDTVGTIAGIGSGDYWSIGKLGNQSSTSLRLWHGLIDDVKIYNYVRTPDQIIEDMNAGHPTGSSPIGTQVAYWGFDEGRDDSCSGGSNDVCNELGTTAYDGTSTASRTTAGKVNGALDFNGSDDVVTITNSAGIDLNNNLASGFTLSAWINPDNDGEADNGHVFWKGDNTFIKVSGLSGSNLTVDASLALGTANATVSSANGAITTGVWNHVAMSYTDDSDDEITLWINGVPVGTSSNGNGSPAAESNNLLIGNNSAGSRTFDGKIDEVKVYSTELTAGQMAVDMNAGASVSYSVLGSGEQADISDGAGNAPLAYWKMDENTGQYIYDTSGNGHTGTLGESSSTETTEDATWTTGKYGSGLKFNGVGNRARLPKSASVKNLAAFTIELWAKPSAFPSSNNTDDLYLEDVTNSAGSTRAAVQILNNRDGCGTNVPGFVFRTGNSSSTKYAVCGSTTLSADSWYHITAVFDSSTDVHKVYLNGREDGSLSQAVSAIENTDPYSLIFVGRTDSTNAFTGSLDDIKVYNYARTPAQIAYDYNRGGPVAYYQFDECQGTTAYNAASALLNGTINAGDTSGSNDSVGSCEGAAGQMWYDGADGKVNASLEFDGTNDYVDVGNTSRTDIYAVSFWAKPADTTESFLQLSATDTVAVSSGTMSIGGFGTETVYIDGVPTTSFPDANWHHVTVISDSAITANDVEFGRVGSTYFSGQLDDVRIFNYVLSANQARKIYNGGAAVSFY